MSNLATITSNILADSGIDDINVIVSTGSYSNPSWITALAWTKITGAPTFLTSVTASSPLFSSGGATPNITIQQASGSQNGYLSSTDWTTFNNKQAAGNYITSLTGEATASGPGAAAVTLNNASVTAKVLTGVNITGGTIQATDTMLTAFGKLQNQINGLVGGSIYQGTWNASTNTPALASGVGTKGYYYIVSVAGNTNLDGITDWFVGDWAIFDGTAWQQVDNTDAVVSVNGQTGAVSLTTDNIPEGATNLYFTQARARASLSFAAGSGAYNSTSGLITIPTNTNQLTNGASFITLTSLSGTAPIVYSNTTGAISITQAGTASDGYLSSTDWNTFNNKQSALTNPVTGTGTAGQVAYWSSGSAITGESNLFWDATNNRLGIGTASPTNLIHGYVSSGSIVTVLKLENASATASSGTAISFTEGGTERAKIVSQIGTGTTPYLAFENNGSERIRIFSDGNTFIGSSASNAGFKLDVNGTGRFSDDLSVVKSGNALLRVQASTITTPIADIELMRGTNTTWGADGYGDYRFRNSGGDLTIQYGDTGVTSTRLTIASTGAATFSSSVTAGGAISTSGTGLNASVRINNTTASTGVDWHLYSLNNGNFGIFNNTAGTYALQLASTGAATFSSSVTANARSFVQGAAGYLFDVQTTDANQPRFQVYVDDTNGVDLISGYNSTAKSLRFVTGNSPRMTITSTGNVGIGTTAPSFQLHINKAGNTGLFVSNTTGNSGGYLYAGGLSGLELQSVDSSNSTAQKLMLQPYGGNVLIGTTTDNGTKLQVNGGISTGNDGLNVGGYNFYTQTISGVMGILGHNLRASASVANQVNVVNSGWYSSMIKMYYSEGITFHTSLTSYSAGDVYPIAATERMRITSGGDVNFSGGAVRADGGYFSLRTTLGTTTGIFIRKASWFGTGSDHTPSIAAEGGYGINFYTNGQTAERMVITSGGNVLIGTTTDSGDKLRVDGNTFTNTITTYRPGVNTIKSDAWKLGRAALGTQPTETHQITVEIDGVSYVIGAAQL